MAAPEEILALFGIMMIFITFGGLTFTAIKIRKNRKIKNLKNKITQLGEEIKRLGGQT